MPPLPGRRCQRLADFDDEVTGMLSCPDEKKIRKAIRMAAIGGEADPKKSGGALRNKGIQPLIEGVIDNCNRSKGSTGAGTPQGHR